MRFRSRRRRYLPRNVFYTLIKDVFDIHAKIDVGRNEFLKRSRNYTISVDKHKDCVLILKAVKLLDSKNLDLFYRTHVVSGHIFEGLFRQLVP